MSQVLISAAHKSSGKTTLTLGLAAVMRRRALAVQPFKKGPDYIDPMWLGLAAGRPCHTLDFYTADEREVLQTVAWRAAGADIALIEGNKGLYDGLDVQGSNSNAALAKLLGAPVVLVLDTQGIIRGVAPLLIGYQAFDPQVRITGVILNRVAGARHEGKLRAVIEHYTDIPILGAVRRDPRLQLTERHLGLIPSNEDQGAQVRIAQIADAVAEQVDVDAVLGIARQAPRCASPWPAMRPSGSTIPVIWRPWSAAAPPWWTWTPSVTTTCHRWTGCSSGAAFRRPRCSVWRPMRPCATPCVPPSAPACPPMPNAGV